MKSKRVSIGTLLVFLIFNGIMLISNRLATDRNYRTGLVNQTYQRATNCFAATSPPNRTPQYVKDCYDTAEKATGVKVERYGDAKE